MTEEKQGAIEWLREIAQRKCNCHEVVRMFGFACGEIPCTECIPRLVGAIAQRVEKERALPDGVEWPRFEDGTPVGIGDDVSVGGEAWKVRCAILREEYWALSVERDYDTATVRGDYGERVKRPAPKVFGADGAPIEVGDVVYYDGEPHPLTVVGITRDGKDALVDANGEESCVEGGRPQDFSHDAPKPVLDADGVPIKVGDTVYFVDGNGRALTVERIDANGGEPAVDLVYTGERIHWHSANPEKLTHERPDSWRLWGDDLDMAVKVGEVDKVEMMRRAKALAKADSEARGVE